MYRLENILEELGEILNYLQKICERILENREGQRNFPKNHKNVIF